jgi:DNA-binding response OmpR family regulator
MSSVNDAFRSDRRRRARVAPRCSRRLRLGDGAIEGVDGSWTRALTGSRAVIVLVCGAVAPEDPVRGLELSPDDEFATPTEPRGLLPRRKVLVHGEPAPLARVLRRADIELDPVHHAARRAGRSLDLSPKEFAVLEALMGTRAVLSAEHLLEEAWDEHTDPFTNTVKVTISRLRKKLGGPPVIENIARVGYRLSDRPTDDTSPEL